MLISVDENGTTAEITNEYVAVDSVDTLEAAAHPMVSEEFFLAHRDSVVLANTALSLATSHPFGDAIPYSSFALIAITLPTFVDGRGHSLARILRARCAVRTPIRALGHILPDQLFFLFRCGFSQFLLDDARAWSVDALQRFHEFSVRYQSAADMDQPIYLQR